MYCASVYDYDSMRGVAVFGNAFGELALCDFGTSSSVFSAFLEAASKGSCASASIGGDILPTVSRHWQPSNNACESAMLIRVRALSPAQHILRPVLRSYLNSILSRDIRWTC